MAPHGRRGGAGARGAGGQQTRWPLSPLPSDLPPRPPPASSRRILRARSRTQKSVGWTCDVGPRGGGTETHGTIRALSGPRETSFPRLAAESCSPERRVGAGTRLGLARGPAQPRPPTTGRWGTADGGSPGSRPHPSNPPSAPPLPQSGSPRSWREGWVDRRVINDVCSSSVQARTTHTRLGRRILLRGPVRTRRLR